MEKKRNSFRGSLGFVLAAAGSAVGLGNIWRFPYLAAQDGGGLFLIIYLILAFTFGFTLLITELAIGRKTKQGPLTAYSKFRRGWGFLGIFGMIIPMMIMPYYSAIGGWVVKYFWAFVTWQGQEAAQDGYFGNYISGVWEPIIMMVIFLVVVCGVLLLGVNKGIESFSKVIMPVLVLLVVGISIFSLTLSYTDEQGVTRTGLQGLLVYIVPNFEGMTVTKFLKIVMDAVGQLFFSLSIAMGIMIAYGSYVPNNTNLSKNVTQIEIFDTVIAFFAGLMILPAVFAFMGPEGLEASGPGLMFVALPKVFAQMGVVGNIVGILFFAMVLFAALTSAISIMEAIVSSIMDKFGVSRLVAVLIEFGIALGIGLLVCFGYNLLYFEFPLPNGSIAQVLDILDYISNYVMMPLLAIGTCIMVGWFAKPKSIIEEVQRDGARMGRRGLYVVMIKFITPILLLVLFLNSFGLLNFIFQ